MENLIHYRPDKRQFHLLNGLISYIFQVSDDGKLLQLYYGKSLPEADYSHLVESQHRPMTTYRREGDLLYSLEHVRQEFPEYGGTDFRHPAVSLRQENGSALTDFVYKSHEIRWGKPDLPGLPATYANQAHDCQTLLITLLDEQTGVEAVLCYSIFSDLPVLTRSCRLTNQGSQPVHIEKLASLSLDLPDADYEMLQLSGSWARERHIKSRRLEQGIQSIESTRGLSSHQHNPFLALKRPRATEESGQVMGAALVYSGNFLAQAEVDTYDVTRVQLGINPFGFDWLLESGASFSSPEAILVFSDQGLNGMSQVFHRLLREHLIAQRWQKAARPVLLNNWEATYFDFDEPILLDLAASAKDLGVELFVLDDGWFGQREHDRAGLGDWFVNRKRLPGGLASLSQKLHDQGLQFGLWFEPEMVNKDSQLYREHPDWILQTPGHEPRHGRNQFVLDFSRPQVVDHIFNRMAELIEDGQLDYIKWDMNRPLTDVYSDYWPADQQGEIFHRYVLGVYDLYQRLIQRFPQLLFESCASGGGRFDPGLLYYAPQTWTSDDTDAAERLKIQYGTSLVYPLSSMGAHVSAVPNHQTNRLTPLETRAAVAFFGSLGYELDVRQLSQEERRLVRQQIDFYKTYRDLIHQGTFSRLMSPFEGNHTAWSVLSADGQTLILAHYKLLNEVNRSYYRVYLQGLEPAAVYRTGGRDYSGAELMQAGFSLSDASCGQILPGEDRQMSQDFDSRIWVFEKVE